MKLFEHSELETVATDIVIFFVVCIFFVVRSIKRTLFKEFHSSTTCLMLDINSKVQKRIDKL